ncbi:MAG: hypothetical protein KAT15_24925, partial [Bacteroidales bacterium]|nr:hypothetical protein [Bacteroidales bacterium]
MHSFSRFCLAVTLCLIANPLFSQYTLETISGDTVFAGQLTEILIVDPGMTRPEHLEAIFMREDPVSFPPCWWCPMDSLRAQSVVTDGSVITATFDIPEDAYPGRFSLTVYDGVSWATWDYMYILSKPYIYDVTGKATICKGEGTQFKVIYYGSGNILKQWYHGDEHLTYATGDSLWVGPAVVKDTGWYHCVLKNQWGEDTASFRLEIPYLEEIGTPVGPERFCNGGGISQYTLQEDPLIALYHWILIPFSAGTLEEEGSTVSISWNAAFSGEAMLFAETGTGTCDLSNSDTLSIWIGPDQVPDICIVGVDEETGKYRVVWNKLLDVPVSAYNVYRESNQAGVFLKLGILSGEEFSVF